MERSNGKWGILAAAVVLAVSLLRIGVGHEALPADLSERADNGQTTPDGPGHVSSPWWQLGWWLPPSLVLPPAEAAMPDADRSGPSGYSPQSLGVAGRGEGARLGVPALVLQAYRRSATRLSVLDPGCNLSWEVLAGIGKVESGHAGGGQLNSGGDTLRPILGPVLDGTPFAAVPDSDGGRLDGDSTWDRAVGPMQFIPGSWARFASDGNDDSVRDPHNVFDAALAAGIYLCVGDADLALRSSLLRALYRYNHSAAYVRTVHAWIEAYRTGGATTVAQRRPLTSAAGPGSAPESTPLPSRTMPAGSDRTSAPASPTRAPSAGPTPTPGPRPSPSWCPVDPVPLCVRLPG